MQPSKDEFFTVHQGDARRLSLLLDHVSEPSDPLLTCTITSPPYADLKNYGHPDQIGWGQTYDEYLIEMRRVFRTIWKHTRLDGSLWVIADTLRVDESERRRLEPLPFQLADEAADAGWVLRETIIWQKDKTLPWSSGGRLRNTFEYVLLFAKSPHYKFRVDRLRDPTEVTKWWVRWPERYNPHGPVPTNIWDIPIPVQGSWKTPAVQHACPLPPDLVERLIFLSTDEGDVVLDPFAGTGVVVAEAERLGRRGVGLELNRKYVDAYRKFVKPAVARRSASDRLALSAEAAATRRDSLIKLRALKYPKAVIQEIAKLRPDLPRPFAAAVIVDPFDRSALLDDRPVKAQLTVAACGDSASVEEMRLTVKEVEHRPPASKFGVLATTAVVPSQDFAAMLAPRKRLFLYSAGHTWATSGRVDVRDLDRIEARGAHEVRGTNYSYPPILSNLELRLDAADR